MSSTTKVLRPFAAALVALALLGGAAACSSGGDDDEADTTTTTEAGEPSGDDGDTTTTTAQRTTDPGDDGTTTTEADDDDGPVDADADAYVEAMMADFEEDDELFTTESAQCLAEKWVDMIGADTLNEAGVSPEDFAENGTEDYAEELGIDEDMANAMYDEFQGCGLDMEGLLRDQFASEELTPEQEACVDENLNEDTLRESFVADLMGEELEEDPLDTVFQCMAPDME